MLTVQFFHSVRLWVGYKAWKEPTPAAFGHHSSREGDFLRTLEDMPLPVDPNHQDSPDMPKSAETAASDSDPNRDQG